ncbi:N-acetylneuraminate lyase [Lactobacillus crispatus]|jgi:N-acetylneuraminate lyase|uniref:N-acetylneuraminate lyase n=2 Tax=Lactobacillus crispatus TaxID=47770 RepID=A0A135ZGN8_9LACO|nr:N-acetylneuraminate lyase [Lactobacillus crispatus]CPR70066.1 dihydrodipicolinate synthase [Chlamydia trachomatis]EEU27999.1 N-acetylneuraminate lyase [Lactobacillus crispatus MV-1A-US]EEX28859.1 sialic acid lyase [Lactobacillus crispatus MV-3A-US]EKB62960.1 N-acetylneuraminate lyase [Lactobacillus crispatus FB049-03]EKB72238.1 N-acetylneuraminate lyase [Lactobacillus crispatus FB077-07]
MQKVYAALMVSFDEDGNIDEKGTREIIRHDIDVEGVDGLYVGGSTGENFMLGLEEKKKIFEIAWDEVDQQVDLIAQVGGPNLKEAKELAKFVTELGYKTISAVTPFYYNFTFDEIKHYYDEIVKDVDAKLLIYSISALTGVSLSLDNFAKLFSNPKIIGVKYTNADFYLLERLRERFPDKLILSGFDEMLLPALIEGVDGCIGSTYNVNARMVKEEIAAYNNGDIAKAQELEHKKNDIITALLNNGIYPSIKLVLQKMGVHAGYNREPMAKYTDKVIEGADEIYAKYFNK